MCSSDLERQETGLWIIKDAWSLSGIVRPTSALTCALQCVGGFPSLPIRLLLERDDELGVRLGPPSPLDLIGVVQPQARDEGALSFQALKDWLTNLPMDYL